MSAAVPPPSFRSPAPPCDRTAHRASANTSRSACSWRGSSRRRSWLPNSSFGVVMRPCASAPRMAQASARRAIFMVRCQDVSSIRTPCNTSGTRMRHANVSGSSRGQSTSCPRNRTTVLETFDPRESALREIRVPDVSIRPKPLEASRQILLLLTKLLNQTTREIAAGRTVAHRSTMLATARAPASPIIATAGTPTAVSNAAQPAKGCAGNDHQRHEPERHTAQSRSAASTSTARPAGAGAGRRSMPVSW